MCARTERKSSVDFDEDDTSIDSPSREERCHNNHLHDGDAPQAIQSFPREVGLLTIDLRLIGISFIVILCLAWDNLTKEVHQAEDQKSHDRHNDIDVKGERASLVFGPVLDTVRDRICECREQDNVQAGEL